MSEYRTKILLGIVMAVLISGGLAYAALSVVPQTGTSHSIQNSSTAYSGSTLGGSTATSTNVPGGSASTLSSSSQNSISGQTSVITSVQSSQQQSGSTSSSGVLNIYLTDAPPKSPQFKYLLVNVSSLTIKYQGGSSSCDQQSSTPNDFVYSVPSSVGRNVNLTDLTGGKSIFLGATSLPSGNATEIIFNISGARAFYTDGNSSQLKVVANGSLMVPIHFEIYPNGSTDMTVDITPDSIHISNGGVLTPVVHVTVVNKGLGTNSTSTTVTSTSISETVTSTSAATSSVQLTSTASTTCSTTSSPARSTSTVTISHTSITETGDHHTTTTTSSSTSSGSSTSSTSTSGLATSTSTTSSTVTTSTSTTTT